jgi:hypothetical protein
MIYFMAMPMLHMQMQTIIVQLQGMSSLQVDEPLPGVQKNKQQ